MKINVDQIKQDSIGKWSGILNNLGIKVGNGEHGPCPICGGKDRFRFHDRNKKGDYICGQCGHGDGFSLIGKVFGINFIEVAKEVGKVLGSGQCLEGQCQPEKKSSPEMLRQMFSDSSRITEGDPVCQYLSSRGLSFVSEELRYHPKCYEPETKSKLMAMLAIFSNSEGKAITIHRTYIGVREIRPGEKEVKNLKKMMPPLEPMTGGACRLFPWSPGQPLGICEGIETAIAIYETMKGMPVWAALSANLLGNFIPPKNLNELWIFADNDKNFTGQYTAYALANRLMLKNPEMVVRVHVPHRSGTDFLDELNEMDRYK